MPESKTPTGAAGDFDVTMVVSPRQRRGDGRAAAGKNAHGESRRHIPEVWRDERVSAVEQVVRHDDGDPVFDVRVACLHFPGGKRRWRDGLLQVALRV